MAITAAFCNSFKTDLFNGVHATDDTYKIALYTSAADLSAATTAYTTSGQVANGNGYTTGGATLVGFSVTNDSGTAILDWTTDPSWAAATITARGALIYNDTAVGKNALVVLDFGADISSGGGAFTVVFPAPAAATGLIRIA
jgi:hypothetical protein